MTGLADNMDFGNAVAYYFGLSMVELNAIVGENSVLAGNLAYLERIFCSIVIICRTNFGSAGM